MLSDSESDKKVVEPGTPPREERLDHRIRRFIRRLFGQTDSEIVRETLRTLEAVSLFAHFARKDLRRLARIIHHRDYVADEHVFHEGDPGLGLYVVQHGELVLEKQGDEAGHTERRIGAGEFFGERALVDEVRRESSARVVADARLLGLFRPDLRILYKRHPQLGMTVVLAVARYLAKECTKLETANREAS